MTEKEWTQMELVLEAMKPGLVVTAVFPRPCTRCGLCCLAERCALSLGFFRANDSKRCPALEREGDVWSCGLISHTESYAKDAGIEWPSRDYLEIEEFFGELLGIGKGCDSTFGTDNVPKETLDA